MSEYAEQQVTGVEWTRCYQVVVDNRLGTVPLATFHEQRVLSTNQGPRRVAPRGKIELPYDPDLVIALRDPDTGVETGKTITGADLYAMIYSAYLHAATERDAAAQEPTA